MLNSYHLFTINIILLIFVGFSILIYKFIYPKKYPPLLVLLLIVSFLPVISILRKGVYESGDLTVHTAFTINFYENLKSGIFIPLWASQLCGNYGFPLFELLYPLPFYISSLFHVIGFSFLNSTKLLLISSYMVSGYTMYFWAKDQFGKTSGFVAAIFYLFAPYHLLDLHYRASVGEVLSFVFIPLVFLFARKIIVSPKLIWIVLEAVSIVLLALSHLATFVATMHLVIVYVIFLYIEQRPKFINVLYYGIAVLLGFLLSSYFWLPAILEVKYTWYKFIGLPGFIPFQELLFSPSRYGLLFQGNNGEHRLIIGYTHLITFIILVILLLKKRFSQKELIYALWLFVSFIFVVFMILPQSQYVWKVFSYMNNFQFSWRLLIIVAFITSTIAGLITAKIKHRGIIILLCIFVILSTILNWGNRKMVPEDNNMYKNEWVLYTEYYDEFYLQNSKRFDLNPRLFVKQLVMKYPKKPIDIIDGNGNVVLLNRTPIGREYIVDAKSTLKLKENTNYFPGWTLKVNNRIQEINYRERNHEGKMVFILNPGLYHITFTFEDTPVRYYSKIVSGSTALLLVMVLVSKFVRMKPTLKTKKL